MMRGQLAALSLPLHACLARTLCGLSLVALLDEGEY